MHSGGGTGGGREPSGGDSSSHVSRAGGGAAGGAGGDGHSGPVGGITWRGVHTCCALSSSCMVRTACMSPKTAKMVPIAACHSWSSVTLRCQWSAVYCPHTDSASTTALRLRMLVGNWLSLICCSLRSRCSEWQVGGRMNTRLRGGHEQEPLDRLYGARQILGGADGTVAWLIGGGERAGAPSGLPCGCAQIEPSVTPIPPDDPWGGAYFEPSNSDVPPKVELPISNIPPKV